MADPALPPGFTVDSGPPAAVPALPAGFALDAPATSGTPVQQTSPLSFSTKDRKGRNIAFTVPQGATDEEVRAAAAKAVGSNAFLRSEVQRAQPAPTDDSALSGFVAGALKPLDNASQWLHAIPGVGAVSDAISDATGLPTTDQAVAHNDAMRANNTRTGYQTLGNIAGTLPLAALPGGVATQGAASGALLSNHTDLAGTALDAGLGAAGSVIGGKALQGLGSLATGVTDKGLRALNAAGVPLTLGQIASAGKGVVSRTVAKGEEALTSTPVLGDIINSARDRGTQGLNTALGNRVLANVGEKLPPNAAPGHDMVDAVQAKLSDRYNALVPKLTGTVDQQFATDLTAAKAQTATLPADKQRQFADIVQDVFGNRMNGGTISGQALKDAESQLTLLAKKYGRSPDADQSIMGDAIDTVRQGLRGMVARSNPQHASELQGLNTAWAQLKALRAASQSAGNNATGVVTPATALRAFTKDGYRDPLLETAKQVLPNSTPDSGTARRGMMALGALSAGGATGAATVSPALAIPAVGSLLYTKTGQAAVNAAAFANRPAAVKALAVPLNRLSRYAPQAVGAAVATRDQ